MVTSVFEKLASSNFRIGEGNGFPKNISKILEAMTCKGPMCSTGKEE